MGESTGIQWTDHTFNPWWGCARVAKGCEHCYAEAFAKRTGHDVWGASEGRRLFGDAHWAEPLKWNAEAKADGVSRLVFCASMADVFEDRDDLSLERYRLFDLIRNTPHLTWQLLTKRPENIARMVLECGIDRHDNVWYGASAATQAELARNIAHLRALPLNPARTFVSLEPLIGPVIFQWAWLMDDRTLSWAIVGGESGPGARPFDLTWAELLIDQFAGAGRPIFFKQAGSRPLYGGHPLKLRDRKGGDLAELPLSVRVRQMPTGFRRAA